MTTCVDCKHWNPKATDAGMKRLGFARCDKKPRPGHTLSASAQSCGQFAQLEVDKVQARITWLKKEGAIA